MAINIDQPVSNAAIWCQRLATFLLPYFLLAILLYRFNKIETVQLFAVMGIGLIIGLVAIILAIRAVIELWNKGIRGGSRVVRGSILALIVLLPFCYYAVLAMQLPLANDVSTSAFDPPQFSAAVEYRIENSAEGMNPVFEYTPEYAQEIVAAYPQLQSRRYPASPERVFEAVSAIIQEKEWPVTATSGLPDPAETDGSSDQSEEQGDESAALDDNEQLSTEITVEFVERTPILGFENDVVVRIISEEQNTLVDLRSASRWGRHDFGYNSSLIVDFLNQLDEALLGIAGEG